MSLEKPRKTATIDGVTFTIISGRERSTTFEARHFFAVGRNCAGYTLFEHDQDIAVTGQAKQIGRKFERLLDTKALVLEIKALVLTGKTLPTDCRPPWEINEPAFRANETLLAADRFAALVEKDKKKAAKP